MLVSRSSLAYWMVTAFRNDFDGAYAADSGLDAIAGSSADCRVTEPTVLDMFTIRGDAERRSSGSIALVTRMTPITFVSTAVRTAARSTSVGCCGMPPVTPGVVDQHVQAASTAHAMRVRRTLCPTAPSEMQPLADSDGFADDVRVGGDQPENVVHLGRMRQHVVDGQHAAGPQDPNRVWPPARILHPFGIQQEKVDARVATAGQIVAPVRDLPLDSHARPVQVLRHARPVFDVDA